MKEVSITSITLDNFKGVRHADYDWKGLDVDVCGDNGEGKSTLADAAYWCLSGKDMKGRKDYYIIPRGKNGEEEHGITVTVSMTVHVVDGEEQDDIVLERSYCETYSTAADGSKRLSGHVTRCMVNGAPRKVSAYSETVEEIMGNAEDYRCLTDPIWFCSTLSVEKRRAILLDMAGGEISDAEIAGESNAWQEMLREAGNRSIDELRSDTVSARNKTKQEQIRVDAAIEQTRRLMPEEQDWSALENDLSTICAEKEDIAKKMRDNEEKSKASDDERIKVRNNIMRMRIRLQEITLAEERKASEEHDAAEREHTEIKSHIRSKESMLKMLSDRLANAKNIREADAKEIAAAEQRLESKRAEWAEVSARQYDGSDTCPTCGQTLPADMIAKARETWNAEKASHMAKLAEEGKELAARVANMRDVLEQVDKTHTEIEREMKECEEYLDEKRKEYARHMVPQRKEAKPTEEMKALQTEIAQAEQTLNDMQSGKVDTLSADLEARRVELEKASQDVSAKLAIRKVREDHLAELGRLEHRNAELAQEKARSLYILDAITGFIKEKSRRTEERVNGLFDGLTFSLFETTLEGNVQATCTPLIDGVPYDAANSSARINAGLEVIERMSEHKGLRLPVWIDNAESTRHIYKTLTQQICLRVTDDSPLRCIML